MSIQSEMKLKYWVFVLLIGFLSFGCATTSSVKNEPLSEGKSRTYEANFDEVVRATRNAMRNAGLKTEDAYELNEETFVIIGKTGVSGFSWGEYARSTIIERESGNTTVRVLTKKKLATNVTAEGDYSDEIFSSLNVTLQPPQKEETHEDVVAQNEREEPQETSSKIIERTDRSGAVALVDTQIPETDKEHPYGIAVVIGNRTYENSDIPNVDYAVRDARITKKYLIRTLGFQEENVIYMENASAADLTRIFGTEGDPKGQLHDWVKPKQSSVFVYYSGHGAPNPETGKAYLLPSDANPSYLSQNGYPLNQLYENLSKIPAQSVTVAMEACFSGTSEGGAVVQNASPAVLSVENPVMGMKNGLAFTAGTAEQVASWYPEKKHGLFTYYFLKGLRGNADANDDNEVTAKEMESYLNDKVPYRAQRMHSRKQTPQVVGQNKDQILVEYEGEVPAN